MRRRFIKACIIVCIVLLSLTALSYVLLPMVLRQAVASKMERVAENQGMLVKTYRMHFSDCSLKGTFTFNADSVVVSRVSFPEEKASVISPRVRMRAWRGFHKVMEINDLRIRKIKVKWDSADSLQTGVSHAPIHRGRFDSRLSNVSRYIPKKVSIGEADVCYHRLRMSFAGAGFRCEPQKRGRNTSLYLMHTDIRQFRCGHPYISSQEVFMDSLSMSSPLQISSCSVETLPFSEWKCGNFMLHPYWKIELTGKPHLLFRIREKGISADTCFSALPSALFQVIPHLKVGGKFDFYCMLDADFGKIDSLKFDFDIRSSQPAFRIEEGIERISRFNEAFEYVFYLHGEPVRTVEIGPSNPYFCPFGQIPSYLTNAILASEDVSFFHHRGFVKSAIQDALIDDIKAGRMKRGGSTISMQLVKNLFLNRNKVVTRKLEEVLLVWMIEEKHLLTKERMFEIYVNIIEWGPGIIGIGEAADFYFHKSPSELSMEECVYLATLIRSPRHYAWTLQPDGVVTEARQQELQFVADHMLERGLMTESQHSAFCPQVRTVVTADTECKAVP